VRVEKLRDLVARLHAQPRRRLTLLVAVDGPAEGGKTTFTRALAALDPGLDVIQMEDFALAAGENGDGGAGRDGLVAEVDWRRLRSHVLLPLSRDLAARYRRFDPAGGAMAEWRMVPVGGIVIVEGRYSCSRPLAAFYDFRIWVDAEAEVRRVRWLEGASGTPESWERAVVRVDEAYAADQDPADAAHLRVDGSGATPHDPRLEYVRLR
jgi:uridine kinase